MGAPGAVFICQRSCQRATPKKTKNKKMHTPCGTQTHSLQIRSLTRYSIAPTGRLLLKPLRLLCETWNHELYKGAGLGSQPRYESKPPNEKIHTRRHRKNNNKSLGPAGTWTRIEGFRVLSDDHYTTGPRVWGIAGLHLQGSSTEPGPRAQDPANGSIAQR